MRELTIKIPQWKDFTKWFWDKFCFPRRKVIVEYFESYNQEIVSDLIEQLFEHWDCHNNGDAMKKLGDVEVHLKKIIKEKTERYTYVICKYKI